MKLKRIEALKQYEDRFMEMGMEGNEAAAEAKHALSSIIGCDISDLYVKGAEYVTDTQQYRMNEVIKMRATGKPLAYILGERWFMGLKFFVTPDVLIPRQETELLAETAIQHLRFGDYATVLDLCTGSGCVAVSIAKYSRARVTATDISSAALEVAKKNARGIGAKVTFIESDLFNDVEGSYDIITANPPYVAEDIYEGLMREVRDFEPQMALVAKDRGLAFYRRIAKDAPNYLNKGGMILLEIGDEQGPDVKNILIEAGFSDVKIRKDYSENARLASGVLK